MGFMDKAKKMAEQAQAKLDEAQKQFNSSQGGQQAGGGPAVEYDKHGRPIQPAPVTPDAAAPVPPAPDAPADRRRAPPSPRPACRRPSRRSRPRPRRARRPTRPLRPAPASAPAAPPARRPGPGAPEDRNRPSTEPPKLSSGDPLAG